MQNISDIKFIWHDYCIFIFVLLVGAVLGVYYGFYKKQRTTQDFLLGGKSMGVIPVALSLMGNNVSGVTILAIPSDVYKYGISYWFTFFCIIAAIVISYKFFLPVFSKLQITSTFEYLKLRFDTKTQLLGSAFYFIFNIFFLPGIIYIPSLALSQATDINLHIIDVVVCTVCIFYTSVGGIKAAVYTDILYSISLIGSLSIVFTLGIIKSGGIGNIWSNSYENDRLTLSFNIDFTERNNIWAITFGQLITWLSCMGVYQVYIQKCLAMPSNKELTKTLIIYGVGIFCIGTFCNFTGLLMYTEYSKCDPLEAGTLQKQDELSTYYIMDIAKQIPGLGGLFIAGVFGATLSTLSACLNSLACTIYQDFISSHIPNNVSEQKVSRILKSIVIVIGTTSTAMVFIVEKMGGMLALSNSLAGITSGPTLGLFLSGMFIPKINEKGAFFGNLLSMLLMSILIFVTQWYENTGYVISTPLPVSTEGCFLINSTNVNITYPNITTSTQYLEDVPYIYRISFYWYCAMGLIMSLTFGLLISLFFKSNKTIHKDLFSSAIHCLLSKEKDDSLHCSEKLLSENNHKRQEVAEAKL